MPTRIIHHSNPTLRKATRFIPLYSALLFLIFHWALTAYVHSSYLGTFISDTAIGVLFSLGASLSILAFLFISRVLRKLGNYQFTMALLIIEFIALIGMALSDSARVVLPLFLIQQSILPILIFNLDIFMESLIGDAECTTGSRRGLMLTISSFIGALASLVAGLLVVEGSELFDVVYMVSAITLLPIIAILFIYFRNFNDPTYSEVKVFTAIRSFWIRDSVRSVFLANLLLQIFFAWMVIFTPLYFSSEIGLSWTSIGIILFVAQLAYVLLEYPIGIIADRYIGEKEMMAFGFFILIISTSWLSFISGTNILPWIIAMFITRVGASFIEVTTESYFFKQTKDSDAQLISFFRVTRPLSYVIGALIASFVLLYLPFNLLFSVLAFFMIPGIFLALRIVDTK